MNQTTTPLAEPVGAQLRQWRQRRRLSQLALACDAEVSQRHLSWVESGRSMPSRELLLRLSDRLRLPLRGRNQLLLAAGYAPMYRERGLDEPNNAAARAAVETILKGHEPWPALAVDGQWCLLMANRALPLLLDGVDPALLAPPVNVLRVSLHPQGLASRILNLAEWRAHVLAVLAGQIESTGDPRLEALMAELAAYPSPPACSSTCPPTSGDGSPPPAVEQRVAVPLRLILRGQTLSFITTTTVFGTPADISLAELAVESFFPADEDTARVLRELQLPGRGDG